MAGESNGLSHQNGDATSSATAALPSTDATEKMPAKTGAPPPSTTANGSEKAAAADTMDNSSKAADPAEVKAAEPAEVKAADPAEVKAAVPAEVKAEVELEVEAQVQREEEEGKNLDGEDKEPSASASKHVNGSRSEPNYVVKAHLMPESQRREMARRYAESQPYTHSVIEGLCNESELRKVRDEIVNNIEATFKETDLFRVLQTGDLAALETSNTEHATKLPTLLALRDELYSEEFRQLVRDITGCGELSAQTDCSCNVYSKGCHLLCHDDVIGTRRVSYIIYLTDPDDPWRPEDGGALELFPSVPGEPHTPDVKPTVSLLPKWNSMAFFTVQPGKSFHCVQEVFASDKPRLSISGWYHAPNAPKDAEKATLKQLMAGEDTIKDYAKFDGRTPDADLDDDDLGLLIRYVNPVYLAEASWEKVQNRFKEEGHVQLQDFLKKSWAVQMLSECLKADEADGVGAERVPDIDAGVGSGWRMIGPPHKQRYLRYKGLAGFGEVDAKEAEGKGEEEGHCSPAAAAAGAAMQRLQKKLFSSGAFARLLRALTTVTQLGYSGEVRRFRPGLDYTVAHYGVLTKEPRLDAVLSFVSDSNAEGEESWGAGEIGGFDAYLLADDDDEDADAAAVYRQNTEESDVLNFPAASNSLNLVLRDQGLMRFTKYVSFRAPSSRWDIAMEFLPDNGEEEEEGAEKKAKGEEEGEEGEEKKSKGEEEKKAKGEEETKAKGEEEEEKEGR